MTCESPDSVILEASINKNIVTTKSGIVIPDAKHDYENGGQGNGLVCLTADGEMRFVTTDTNLDLIKIAYIFINNLEFTAIGTDPLALQLAAALSKIKNLLKIQVKYLP